MKTKIPVVKPKVLTEPKDFINVRFDISENDFRYFHSLKKKIIESDPCFNEKSGLNDSFLARDIFLLGLAAVCGRYDIDMTLVFGEKA